jgi:nucleotide-binding universal stress UspA family protein
MKKILVPTDFSPVAYNALEYAIEIAAAMKSELYLYHVYHIHRVDYNLDFPDDEQPIKRQAEQKMNLLQLKCKNKIDRKGLTMHTIVEQDDIFSLFKRKTKEYEIDLIVMGSKGATGLKRAVFGSTAVAALEMSKVPVLVVRLIILSVLLNTLSFPWTTKELLWRCFLCSKHLQMSLNLS